MIKPSLRHHPLRVTFILPFVNITGGIKILFEHANRLAARGHRVSIIYPGVLFHGPNYEISNRSLVWQLFGAPFRQLKYWFFVELLRQTEADWFPIDKRVQLKRTPDLSARFIPEADIVIATANETADWVTTYPDQKGIKIFFCQDYEVWARPEKYVDRTLTFPMHLITIGSWQKKLFSEKFGREVEVVIPDGVDTARFKPARATRTRKSDEPVRVLLSYHHLAYKGIPDGLAAIETVRQAGHKIQIVMFGVHPMREDMPKDIEYHQNLLEDELPDLYRSCDILLWPTHREGFGLPPMEAMACGVPVVGTDAGAITDYCEDGKTGFITPIQRPDLLAEKLLLLVADPKLREKMGQAGAKAMLAWDWDRQTEKLEQYILSLVSKEPDART